MPKYKYSTHSPNELSQKTGEIMLPGHRMGYRKRTDTLKAPGDKRVQYRARCLCRWEDDTWVAMRHLETRYYKEHIVHVKKELLA